MRTPQPPRKQSAPRFRLLKHPGKIWHDQLKAEIGRRNLSLATVAPYLKQASVEDARTKKRYSTFAFLNDKGGYELSIPNPYTGKCFKTVIGPKAITSIECHSPSDAYVFEGFWDTFSWLAMNRQRTNNDDICPRSTRSTRPAWFTNSPTA
jgi:hypothetical protein